MRDIPECLNRRYKALDELIRDLSSAMGSPTTSEHPNCENNIGIKLMCDFWNILKDDPDCDLTEEVQQRMCVQSRQSSGVFGHQRVDCFMANKELDKCNEDRRQDAMRRIKHICCNQEPRSNAKRHICGKAMSGTPSVASDKMPLSKVLCNLKEAASFDKKCNVRVGELMAAQKELIQQIQTLEQRENEGVKLLKQADCMWSCMEDTYKKKVAESNERQKELLKELKEVEASATKWRKNKKDLEFQLTNITKIEEEIGEKTNQKKNDMKVMDMEIEDFKKRIESNENDTEIAKKSLKTKRDASDSRMGNIAAEMTKAQKKVTEEQKVKADKERDGSKYVKEAREDLQHMCRVLLQKKLENEDLKAEKEALLDEISLLRTTFDTCKEKCKIKEINMAEEIKRLDGEIADHKTKCIKCHECTDTVDVIKYCTDCPRCLKERDCLYENGHCSPDHSMDCVCMSMKQKFLDNVFDNMYTVLERQSKTSPGKAVADAVLNCLKRSRNGKLNQETRRILQDFILTTVKKNLNLTIVGGAVKTRCEMDPETYKQLMLCLKDVTVSKPVKEDKATGSKKEPCHRWGGPSECNCPKGPKACICTKKAPPPPHDPAPCGPPDPEDMVDVIMCPHKENTPCGPDCGMQGVTPKAAEIDVAAWRPDPCQAQTCPFSKNMRAAQCVLGPEALAATPKTHPTPPIIPILPNAELMGTCSCGDNALKPCPCHGDRRSQPRQRIIEEVMGRYTEIPPIERVTSMAEHDFGELNSTRRIDARCDCSNLPLKYLLASNISDNKISQFCACSSNYVSREVRTPFIDKLRKKGHLNICRSSKSNTSEIGNDTLWPDVRFKTSQRHKSGNDIKVILCPKFPHIHDDKIELSLGISNMLKSENIHLRFKNKSSLKIDQDINASFVERKVCETVKELMKDIVVPEVPLRNNQSSSDVEWVTLESLFKEITSLTNLDGSSNDTANEVEVKCETLEALKDFKSLNENICDLQTVAFNNNIIDIQQNKIIDQKYGTNNLNQNVTVPNEEYYNIIAEELKTKLLDDIRQTYNISVETSLENITDKEPDINMKKFKNIRKCLRNLEETVLENNKCNCYFARHRNKYDYDSTIKTTKKYFQCEKDEDDIKQQSYPSGINEVKKYLTAMSNMQKDELQKSDNKFKNQVRNKIGYLKPNKNKKVDKRNK